MKPDILRRIGHFLRRGIIRLITESTRRLSLGIRKGMRWRGVSRVLASSPRRLLIDTALIRQRAAVVRHVMSRARAVLQDGFVPSAGALTVASGSWTGATTGVGVGDVGGGSAVGGQDDHPRAVGGVKCAQNAHDRETDLPSGHSNGRLRCGLCSVGPCRRRVWLCSNRTGVPGCYRHHDSSRNGGDESGSSANSRKEEN